MSQFLVPIKTCGKSKEPKSSKWLGSMKLIEKHTKVCKKLKITRLLVQAATQLDPAASPGFSVRET